MGEGSMEDLERRRDTRRRNRRVASTVVAVVVAAAGATAAFVAFRDTAPAPRPAASPPLATTLPGGGEPQPPSSTLQFLDQQHGWGIFGGQLVKTADGGKTWSTSSTNPQADLVQFVDSDHGWAASSDELWQTTDGGDHWRSLGNEVLTSFQFLKPQVGWGVEGGHEESAGLLVRTDDGGQTWRPQDIQANSICFSGDNGWATGPSAGGITLLQTLDGGKKWTENEVPLPNADQVPYVATVTCSGIDGWLTITGDAGAGHVAYAVFRTLGEGSAEVKPVLQDEFTHPLGQQMNVFESTDPQPGPLVSFSGLEADFITWCPACGPTSALNVTRDGGATWDRFELPKDVQGEPVGLSFLDQDNGWVTVSVTLPNVGGETSNVFTLRTSDGGKTWSMVSVYRTAG